jgi:hypothetical protein
VESLAELRIYKAIDFILISIDLIIDKMFALIRLLENGESGEVVTYENIVEYIGKVLKAKSTISEVADVKTKLK